MYFWFVRKLSAHLVTKADESMMITTNQSDSAMNRLKIVTVQVVFNLLMMDLYQ